MEISENRIFALDSYLKKKFGCKVYKLALNLAKTCPNRDGSKGIGGCDFCSEKGSGDFSLPFNQLQLAKERLKSKQTGAYIAYFQSFSNTYLPLEVLVEAVENVFIDNAVVGVAIATRADCLNQEILDFLESLSKKTHLSIELGLNTVNDATNFNLNRCLTYKEFLFGYNLLVARGIKVCVHIINGLPGESESDMLQTARKINALNPFSIKIHCLHILEGTKIAQSFIRREFEALSQDKYTHIVCNQLALIDKNIVVERLTGDGSRKDLIAPLWTLQKRNVLNGIHKHMLREGLFQGCNIKVDKFST